MIYICRKNLSAPAILHKPIKSGRTERQDVEFKMDVHRSKEAQGKEGEFKYSFKRYREDAVKSQLAELFQGKCAYCESRYAGTQPMDVEHWRPKGEIHLSTNKKIKPGYYWLAAEWENLLPSCIDCNRARTQFDTLLQENIVLGKQNQFPILDETTRILDHRDDPVGDECNPTICASEEPLLINPCEEDPEFLLCYDENGVIHPSIKDRDTLEYKKAVNSIRVYALNRSELVSERLGIIVQIDHRVSLIETLGEIRKQLREKEMTGLVEVISDLIAEEIDSLIEMGERERPFAGLARQLIREASPFDDPPSWTPSIPQ